MELLNSTTNLLHNFDASTQIFSYPSGHVIALLIFGAFCIIWGRFKWGLLGTYVYMFYWSFANTKMQFVNMFDGNGLGMLAYIFVGLLASIMIFTSAFQRDY